MCVRDYQFSLKGRETSKGDRVSRYCELSKGGSRGEECVNAFEKPAQDEMLWRFMTSENRLVNVLKPERVHVSKAPKHQTITYLLLFTSSKSLNYCVHFDSWFVLHHSLAQSCPV